MKQIHDRVVFCPIRIDNMSETERNHAMESLMFLFQKKCVRIKARTCANGSTQRQYITKDEATSPTISHEAKIITGVIEAKQKHDIMTADIPYALVQTDIDQSGKKIIMKIREELVDILVDVSPEIYSNYVVQEKGQSVLYVQMLKALYGMMVSSLLYYKKLRKDIESIGFEVNPYDTCVANQIIKGKQHTITWHVDDVKSSHEDIKVNDEFFDWLKDKYANDKIGEVKAKRGTKHNYLGMTLDYKTPGILKIDMTEYVKSMIEECPHKVQGRNATPWTENLFKVDANAKQLGQERKETFHTFLMKGMFLCKQGRPDIQPAIAFLSTRCQDPN